MKTNYEESETLLSKQRLNSYLMASYGNEQKALELYIFNIELSKDFYGLLNLFEIVLRNAINEHYKEHFRSDNWIFDLLKSDFFPDKRRNDIIREYKKLVKTNVYSPEKFVSVLTLGVWVEMFSSHCFNKGNQTLLKIFPHRHKGINQKTIHEELNDIRHFRNKIAHYESICFDTAGKFSTVYAQSVLEKTLKYFDFLGASESKLLLHFSKSVETRLKSFVL